MVNFKKTSDEDKVNRIDEVGFSNHAHEFIRFYDKHKMLCDEISGVKKRFVFSNDVQQEFYITRVNFFQGIKRLNAFIIDNIHYVGDYNTKNEITRRIEAIEKKYITDEKYQYFIKYEKNLSDEEDFKFNRMYFDYVFECLDLSFFVFTALQETLMISTRDKKKSIRFYDVKQFFENLSHYRDEISSSLSDLRFSNVFTHFKKVLAYHYTYRFILGRTTIIYVDKIIRLAYTFLMNKRVCDLIIEARKKYTDDTYIPEIYDNLMTIKKMLSEIYTKTNESLSERNILPKVEVKILIDKTLI